MENLKGNNTRSVPQFGGWDHQSGGETNYSMVFQKARDNRKKHTNEVATNNRAGNERELLNKPHDIPIANRKKHIDEVVGSNNVGNEQELLNKPDDIPVANRNKHTDEVVASNNVGNERELLNKPHDIPVANRKRHNEVAAISNVRNDGELLNKPQDHDIPVANNTRYVPQFRGWDQITEGETNYSMVFQKVRANRKKHFIEVPTSNSVDNESELHNKQQNQDVPVVKNIRSVPQFGGWDNKTAGETNYSTVFQQVRADRKMHINEVTTNNVGNESELLNKPQDQDVPTGNNMRSVPQFGEWDHKTGGDTNYSMVFQQARANKKKQKNEATTSSSVGNERELLNKPQNQNVPVVKKKRLRSYLSCCIRPY